MTAHIQRFVDRVRSCEQRGQRELTLNINEARDLHADITKLLALVHELHEKTTVESSPAMKDIEIDGGGF